MHVTRLYQRLSLLFLLCMGLVGMLWGTQPTLIRAQVTDPCIAKVIPYGQPIPTEQLFSSKSECEKGFLTQCLPDGATVGQTGKCCTGKSYQSGNVVKCGVSPVAATSCKVAGITMSAGGTACGAQGDTFEYVCVANGTGAVGSNVDDTGASVLQRRTCRSGWACKNNACAPLFSDITLGSPALPTVRGGEICNETGGCTCFPSGSLSGSPIKKFDVCGGSSTVASQATCTSQCVAGNSCPGTSTNGVGLCPVNFKCCAPLENANVQTTAQQTCVSRFNSTGAVQDLACGTYLVSQGLIAETEVASKVAEAQAVAAIADASYGVVSGLANAPIVGPNTIYNTFNILTNPNITPAQNIAAALYVATGANAIVDSSNRLFYQTGLSPAEAEEYRNNPFLRLGDALTVGGAAVGVGDFAASRIAPLLRSATTAPIGAQGSRFVDPQVAADYQRYGSNMRLGEAYYLDPGVTSLDTAGDYFTQYPQYYSGTSVSDDLSRAVADVATPGNSNTLTLDVHGSPTSMEFQSGVVGPNQLASRLDNYGLIDSCTIQLNSCDTGFGFADRLGQGLYDRNYQDVTIYGPLGPVRMLDGYPVVEIPGTIDQYYPLGTGWRQVQVTPTGVSGQDILP